jgi:oxaloacetate decarboxylase alpha subunit
MKPLHIMDTTIRDGQQSLWATRMTIGDMLPILPKMDQVGYWAIEAWGGATFDSCLRFLDENPWERLRAIKKNCPNTPLSMLVRGQNLVGYRHYSKDIVNHFIACSHKNGIDVFRVFDALNDIRNIQDCAEAIKACGAIFEPAISYTVSPVHTMDSYVDYAKALKELGADTIAIKDMAGLLTPYRAARLTEALKDATGLPIHLHCHYVGGMAPTNYIKAAEAGASIVDTASAPLAFGNSQPAVEMVVAAFKESGYDTGIDLDLLFEIAEYWEEVRKRGHYKRGISTLIHMQVYKHQIPGGMMSNLVSQLETQHASDRLPDVIEEIPRVRAEIGFPPLVTPMSQITGTQAVLNVLTGKRWSVVTAEMKNYLCGRYGKAPGPLDQDVLNKVLGPNDEVLPPDVAPGSIVTDTFEQMAEEIGPLAKSEEDVLMYALFPNEAKAYLTKHRTTDKVEFMMEGESSQTKEEDYVDINQIRELIRTVEESDVAEVTVKDAGSEITVRKPGAFPAGAGFAPAPAAPAAAAPAPASAEPAKPKAADSGNRPDTWVAIKSPMVGTFYAAPAPDKPPFVKVGDEVMAGATLCIVEAMKLMNEIPAETMCVVREICCENADPVEFDQVLFYVEPVSSGVGQNTNEQA